MVEPSSVQHTSVSLCEFARVISHWLVSGAKCKPPVGLCVPCSGGTMVEPSLGVPMISL